MKTVNLLVVAAAAAALSACMHPVDTANAPSFGASVSAMVTAQAIPTDARPGAPTSAAAVGVLSQQRYRSGEQRPLLPSSTSTNSND